MRHQNSPIAFIGCPTKDVGPVEKCVVNSRFHLRPAGRVDNGDRVVFCISACYGPTVGTRKAIESPL